MDQRTTRIEQDINDIVHTRVAIAEKLEMLEQQVEQKMERSKIAVQDLVDHTAGVVGDMVHKTKQTLDPLHQFGERPWVMLGGAVMLGYLAGRMETRLRSSGVYPYYTGQAPHEAPVMPSSQQNDEARRGVYPFYPAVGGQRARESDSSRGSGSASSLLQDLSKEMMEELDQVKAGLIEAGRGFIRDVTSQIIPTILRSLSESTSSSHRSSAPRARYPSSDR
ncbi:MAG: hypothetical protein ABW047_16515 [Nitrospiraceae bacterium]